MDLSPYAKWIAAGAFALVTAGGAAVYVNNDDIGNVAGLSSGPGLLDGPFMISITLTDGRSIKIGTRASACDLSSTADITCAAPSNIVRQHSQIPAVTAYLKRAGEGTLLLEIHGYNSIAGSFEPVRGQAFLGPENALQPVVAQYGAPSMEMQMSSQVEIASITTLPVPDDALGWELHMALQAYGGGARDIRYDGALLIAFQPMPGAGQ